MNNQNKKTIFLITTIILLALLFFVNFISPKETTYQYFFSAVENGSVENVVVSDSKILFTNSVSKDSFKLTRISTDNIIDFLLKNNIDFSVSKSINSFPILLLLALFSIAVIFYFKRKISNAQNSSTSSKPLPDSMQISFKESNNVKQFSKSHSLKTASYSAISEKDIQSSKQLHKVFSDFPSKKTDVINSEQLITQIDKKSNSNNSSTKSLHPQNQEDKSLLDEIINTQEEKKPNPEVPPISQTQQPRRSKFSKTKVRESVHRQIGSKRESVGLGKSSTKSDKPVPIYKQYNKNSME